MTSLKEQRSKLFVKFTKNCLANPKFHKLFVRTDTNNIVNTRRHKQRFKPIPAKTKTYQRSAILQMVMVANSLKPTAANTTKLILNSGVVIMI